ncbi:hypothetical protein [Neobacillus sp. SAB-20_R2A]|uniref:hypothetical protein n=1 Tax=Neobacillus sp. SAB-20_R2A TaxID=3120519 RepID=UPI003C6DC6A1
MPKIAIIIKEIALDRRCNNFNIALKNQIKQILLIINQHGPSWKPGKEYYHLLKRKKRRHIPLDWELQDYNRLIMNILNDKENDIYIYFKEGFLQNYFIFADGNAWIVIIGEDGIIDTAMIADNYFNYLDEAKGYSYIGKIKEVWQTWNS